MRFGCRSTSADVGDESVESGDHENLSITVGTECLSVVEREIELLPVWRPSFCSSGVGRWQNLIDYVPYIWAGKIPFEVVGISQTFRLAAKICAT